MRMRAALALPLSALLALGGCAPGPAERGAVASDPLLPPGHANGAIVDPLIVGDRLMAAGEPELALASYIRAGADAGGIDNDVKLSIATANIELGRLNQAEDALREIVAEEPRNAHALNNLGVLLLQTDRAGAAVPILRTAFALQPSPEIRANLTRATSMLPEIGYDDDHNDAFTLTRRDDGVYALNSPDG